MAAYSSRSSSVESDGEVESSSDSSSYASNKRKKSDVWPFFEKKGTSKVTSKLCKGDYAYRGGTSNLREHLVRIHPSDFYAVSKGKEPLKQSTIDGFVSRAKCSVVRSKQITELIVTMVACDIRPAAIVEGECFKGLLKFIEPGYKVPTSTHIAKIIHEKHILGKRLLKEKLQTDASAGLALTTDIWSSCANDAYISLTAHFIDEGWNSVSCLLATSPFPGQHTAVNIVQKIKENLAAFSIDISKVVGIVHDQASNMILTGELLEADSDMISLSCAAHKLQLCIEEGLSIATISRAIGAASKLVGHFNSLGPIADISAIISTICFRRHNLCKKCQNLTKFSHIEEYKKPLKNQ